MITVKIVSLGPAGPELMNEITKKTIICGNPLILRTTKHPASAWMRMNHISFRSLDSLYEISEDFDILCETIADTVWDEAAERDCVVYAVPDAVTDSTVDAVIHAKPQNGNVIVIPGLSYSDYYLSACRTLFPTADLQTFTAAGFMESDMNPSLPVLITEVNDVITAGEIKRHFCDWLDDEETVWFISAGDAPYEIRLFELDRQKKYDHLTAVASQGRNYRTRKKKTFPDLMHIMNLLRSNEGCPWDRKQTHESLLPYMIEEAWEVVDAIRELDFDHVAEELGDLLFQIAFHTSIAASFDEFSVSDVLTGICDKMIRRHPDVFDDEKTIVSFHPDEWERIKQQENGSRTLGESLMKISKGLTALQYTEKVVRKLQTRPSFARNQDEILASLQKTCKALEGEALHKKARLLGILLFNCVELAVCLGENGELVLRETSRRLVEAYRNVENQGNNSIESLESLTFNDLGVY